MRQSRNGRVLVKSQTFVLLSLQAAQAAETMILFPFSAVTVASLVPKFSRA